MVDHTRVLIIGGGVYGVSVLYHLAREGWTDITLVEKGELTSGSTWHAAGNTTNFASSIGMSLVHDYGIKLYKKIQQETGQDTGFHHCGGMRLALKDEEVNWFKRAIGIANHNGVELELITPDEVKEKHPFVDTFGVKAAVWMPNDAYVDPAGVTMAMAQGARNRGARIMTNNRVTDLKQRASGEWEVVTEKGLIVAEQIINAGGSFARRLGEMMGIKLPIVDMIHHYLVTEMIPEIETLNYELPLVRDPYSSCYFRQERKGLVVGPYEEDGAKACYLDGPDWSTDRYLFPNEVERLMPWLERAMERMPLSGSVGVRTTIAGAIPHTPDGTFLLGPAPGLHNAWLACGSSVGICQGAGSGKFLAQWMVHGQAEISMNEFDPRRWGDYACGNYVLEKATDLYHNMYQIHPPGEDRDAGRPIFKTPMYDRQLNQGAVFGEAFGWERPKWFAYNGETEDYSYKRSNTHEIVAAECRAVREKVAVLDLTSFSKYEVSGKDAEVFLDRLVTNKVPAESGKTRLCYALNANGFIESEWTITRLKNGVYYLLGPALAQTRDLDKLLSNRQAGEEVDIQNVSYDFGCLVIAGPQSRALLSRLTDACLDNEAFPWLDAREITVGGAPTRALRLSYAGELGWELHMSVEHLDQVYASILEKGVDLGITNVGIYAINSLRLEKGYGAWGHEYTMDVLMQEAELSRFVNLNKGEFIGREALIASQSLPPRKHLVLMKVASTDADCLGSEPVYLESKVVGLTSSGAYGHTLGMSLAFAYIDAECGDATEFTIELQGQQVAAQVLSKPKYDPDNLRLKS